MTEYDKVVDEIIELINNTYSVKRIPVKTKGAEDEKGIIYDFPDYYGTVIYGYHTKIGNFIIFPINVVLTIVCLALYFPLTRAIINLLRRKAIAAHKIIK